MKIAVEGCAHGELEDIYNSLAQLEEINNVKIDLLLCCGDFQSTRNLEDLRCMSVPSKYYNICTFYKYYSGELVAPYLTIFIGGNHEASNYLQELPYGGWVAPNIYYLGYAGVIDVAGIRIAGISGIYKGFDYRKGHFEKAPYTESTKRSVYHIRSVDIFRLRQISKPIDVFLSHDWPKGVQNYGDVNKLLEMKPFFRVDIESDSLGSPPCQELLNLLKPNYWFAAHLHCKFAAIIPHEGNHREKKTTKFLALDKCLPHRQFLQIADIPHDPELKIELKYDLEWLTILFLTNHLLSVKESTQYMPGAGHSARWKFTPTEGELDFIRQKFENDLTIPLNFIQTAPAYSPQDDHEQSNITQPAGQTNQQTELFCEKLGIDDPTYLVLTLNHCATKSDSFKNLIPLAVEIQKAGLKLNSSCPQLNLNSISPSATPGKINKFNLTLPPPKHTVGDFDTSLIIEEENSIWDSSASMNNSTSIFSDNVEVCTSTPQMKKFKRRNASIYQSEDTA